ncbi:MAG TPA: hypothetical protein VJH94_01550 [Candidatus Paceibacterota bacterium]
MNIIHFNIGLLEKWASEYSGLTFEQDKYYQNGSWQKTRGMDRLVSNAFRYLVKNTFFDAVQQHGFALCPIGIPGTLVYYRNSFNRSCVVALEGKKQLVLDLVVACELSGDRTEVTFAPQVRYIHHNIGDHQSERWRGVCLDPLFPILIAHGRSLCKDHPSFLNEVRKGLLCVSLKRMGHNIQSLTSFFEEFTGGNQLFQGLISEFKPTPQEDVFVVIEKGVREQLLSQWKQQLKALKTKLVPAV